VRKIEEARGFHGMDVVGSRRGADTQRARAEDVGRGQVPIIMTSAGPRLRRSSAIWKMRASGLTEPTTAESTTVSKGAQLTSVSMASIVPSLFEDDGRAEAGRAQALERGVVAVADAAPDVVAQVLGVDVRAARASVGSSPWAPARAQGSREDPVGGARPVVVGARERPAARVSRAGSASRRAGPPRLDGHAGRRGVRRDADAVPEGQREADVDQQGARAWPLQRTGFVV
jgi:hypothetical protein